MDKAGITLSQPQTYLGAAIPSFSLLSQTSTVLPHCPPTALPPILQQKLRLIRSRYFKFLISISWVVFQSSRPPPLPICHREGGDVLYFLPWVWALTPHPSFKPFVPSMTTFLLHFQSRYLCQTFVVQFFRKSFWGKKITLNYCHFPNIVPISSYTHSFPHFFPCQIALFLTFACFYHIHPLICWP